MNEKPPLLTLYAPLPGATFDSEDSGLVGGNVFANVPFDHEWRNIEKTDVILEKIYGSPQPPVCLCVFEPLAVDEEIDPAIVRAGAHMLQQAHDAVIVLRMSKGGWFLDPDLAQTCFAVAGSGWQIRRRPGPYRQAFLRGITDLPFASYSLHFADLTTSRDQPGPTATLWAALTQFRERSGNASVDIALENFNHSYAFQLTPVDRLANLFMALDAMLGGMSAWRVEEVPLRKGGFRKRVEASLSIGPDRLDPAGEAAWLDDLRGGRGLRNAVAHGGALDTVTVASVERIQQIVRLLLRQYLTFAVQWADDQPGISARFRLPESCSLAAGYNKVLEARAAQSDPAVDLLS